MSKLFNLLEKKISEQAQAYYSDGSQTVSDAEFDEMVEELKATKPDSELLKIGWGYDVHKDSTPGAKVPHRYGEAGSLDKCRTWEELGKDFQDTELWASLKLDGISVVLYYEQGKLTQALTRGDGHIGIDITDKIQVIMKTSDIIDTEFTGAVRGEILMPLDNFSAFQKHSPEAKNPRNSTAGLINSKEISDDLKYLEVVVYTVVGVTKDVRFDIYIDMQHMVTWLANNFHLVAPYIQIHLSSSNYLDTFNTLKYQWYNRYPADGIVITKQLYAPDVNGGSDDFAIMYQAKAFKFKSETADATVVEVEWNMSKTGYAVPLIHIEPVQLAGTTVSKCTGYNAQYIQKNQIGPGAVVEVEKRGEIIPNVNKVITTGRCEIPACCPKCGESLVWNGVHLQCNNSKCKNAEIQDLICWLKYLAPVDGFGDILKLKFLSEVFGEDNLNIEAVMSKPYTDYPDYVKCPETSHRNLFASMIKKLYTADIMLYDAILALNIPRIGDVTARKLSEYPDIVRSIYHAAQDQSYILNMQKLYDVIGTANTQAITANLNKFNRWRFIYNQIQWDSNTESAENKGKVAITGKLSVKRSEFEKELRAAGYTPAEISKDTKFLITDDPNSSSSKNKKADDWSIQKITEKDFRNKYLNPKD